MGRPNEDRPTFPRGLSCFLRIPVAPMRNAACVVIAAITFGCARSAPPKPTKVDSSMPTNAARPTLAALLDASMDELRFKTEAHTAWGLGAFDTWAFDQNTGQLVFTDRARGRAETPAQIVGSYDSVYGTWQWAWGNSSVAPELTRDALVVKAFGEREGYVELTQGMRSCSEDDAWRMAALAVKLNEKDGAYRGPAGDGLFVFLSFGKVRLSKGEEGR